MAVTIVPKGESVSLRGKNALDKVLVGLGWDANEGQSTHPFDLDASAVCRDAKGEAIDGLVCYFNAKEPAPWIKHHGDNLTGAGEGDDEQISIDLSAVPANVAAIDLVVHLYDAATRKQHFGMGDSSYVRLVNADSDAEVVRTDLSSDQYYGETGVLFARLVRKGPMWEYQATGEAKKEYSDLPTFANTPIPVTVAA